MSEINKNNIIDKRKTLVFKVVFVLLALSVVYAVVMLINAPSGVSKKEYEYVKTDYVLMILQCVVGMIVIFLPSRVEQKFGIDIPDIMEIIYFIFLFCAIYLGEVQNFYYRIPFWDMILHAFSAGMLGALGFVIVDFLNHSEKSHIHLSPFFVSLFALCFAVTCGVVWEIYEYTADHILGTNMQKFMTADGTVLSGHATLGDTMKDIIVDLIGALVIVSLGYVHLRKKERRLAEKRLKQAEKVQVVKN
ncbi:hypothetical protein [Vagococcus acidifermentans]|uniref:Membrane-spanning protein n=1 Tax=Vagococcus acidifermentans TaxID=564710 RepID=A0A430AZ90_9ENTE|nr:hypothetical protein [Vagococcus acidifermentans]RSU13387.1 hypothetical protein CBF27_04195 [Vagococcus acidifermentans]